MELLLKLCQNHFLFSSCLFAFTIRNIRLWMEILCAANCWTLKQMPPPPSVFCTLGCVVTSPLLLLFYSSLYKGSVLTLWKWGCKIRMTMCEMETSVYHFAIRTLQCSFLPAIKSLSYAFISWFAFIFIFFINSVLECFLKAGRSAELPLPLLCLEHRCSRSQKRGTKEGLPMGLRSPGRALELCRQQVVFCTKEPSCSLWEQMNSGEQAKMWHHLGIISSPPSSASPCYWGRNCSAALSLNWFVRLMCKQSHNIGRRSYLNSETKLQK